ncbi:MAG: hypothetical protein AW09_004180 [Candidatus Accumulibacter phosphatis]|uniref:Uncharacterized protein n=1 Tax=Candidatus Accumulibacter phosphatis TaxID=327160 RepID=A0A080LT02_9PROT|nr:MAG: hypothetical protein AW09_004180 [Candidatus Accumulibacter phosphatis]
MRSERHHVGLDRRARDTRDDHQARIDQATGDRHREIRRIVIGDRQHAATTAVLEAGHQQLLRLRRVGTEGKDVGREVFEFEFLDARLTAFDGHHADAVAVERARNQQAGLAAATEDIEGFAKLPDLANESTGQQHLLKTPVLDQRQQADDRVRPADHREEDHHRHPHPLRFGKRAGQLAEADRAGGVADEVESVKEAHRWRRPPFRVDAGNQRQAERRQRINDDQHDQRRPHPPQGEEEDAGIHRGMQFSDAASRFRRSAGSPRRHWQRARHRSAKPR